MRGSFTRIVMFVAALARSFPRPPTRRTPPRRPAARPRPRAAPPSPFALSGGGNALVGRKVRFRGGVEERLAGHTVVVQYLDPATQTWTQQARASVKADGTFIARWRARRTGQFQLRAVVRGEASSASVSPELPLTVYRGAVATWYGPGFYGNTTACGIELTPGARRRRPPQPPVRNERRRALRIADAGRPGRRPRAVRLRGALGPHRGAPRSSSASRTRTASARSALARATSSRRRDSRRSGSSPTSGSAPDAPSPAGARPAAARRARPARRRHGAPARADLGRPAARSAGRASRSSRRCARVSGTRARRPRPLPREQARAVARGVDHDRPLVAERVAGLERDLGGAPARTKALEVGEHDDGVGRARDRAVAVLDRAVVALALEGAEHDAGTPRATSSRPRSRARSRAASAW